MRASTLRLYAPFIALVLVQAALVVLAPSRGERVDPLAGLTVEGDGAGGSAGPVGPDATESETSAGSGIGPGGGGPGPFGGNGGVSGGTGSPESPGTSPTPFGPSQAPTSPRTPAGDASHCTSDGRQTGLIFRSPPCAPVFAGDNLGSTYPGVTATEIKVVVFNCQSNEQVDALLASQGLATRKPDREAMIAATVEWMNDTYEFYGRKIVAQDVVGDCTVTPPDPARDRQAAVEVAQMEPAFVIHRNGGATTHDVWNNAGIVSLLVGGNPDKRPFSWGYDPAYTDNAAWVSEYYCKKLAGKPASRAGQLIHLEIGGRNTPRKVAILTFQNEGGGLLQFAEQMQSQIRACTDEEAPIFTYAGDINRAEEQSRVITGALIDARVTTVICLCDPIAPAFLTNTFTRNSYFPEHVLSSALLTDYDPLGRLYDSAQWTHAFGPSKLPNPVPFEQTDAARIWRASGRSGQPCSACVFINAYLLTVGEMIQQAGPNLNPLTIEKAMVDARYRRGGWAETGGDPSVPLIKFGPGDYAAMSDFREVYWDPGARSQLDGNVGAYVAIEGGRRYEPGQLDGQLRVPVKPQ